MKGSKSGEAAGPGDIPVEVRRGLGERVENFLTGLLTQS